MKINDCLLSNTVPAKNQTNQTFKIFENPNSNIRVLFLGNSITLHEKKPSIGWNFNWGMAASKEDKDYVHLVLSAIRKKYGIISYCIANVSRWERNYWCSEALEYFSGAKDFEADLVIIRLGENLERRYLSEHPLGDYFCKFVKYFSKNSKKVIVTDLFWEHDYICNEFKSVAKECGCEFVKISDLGYVAENKALGLFENSAVAEHPNDAGMQKIAERILEKI